VELPAQRRHRCREAGSLFCFSKMPALSEVYTLPEHESTPECWTTSPPKRVAKGSRTFFSNNSYRYTEDYGTGATHSRAYATVKQQGTLEKAPSQEEQAYQQKKPPETVRQMK
jgi:hypothetical protein